MAATPITDRQHDEIYTVKDGDTLSGIAKTFPINADRTPAELYELGMELHALNKGVIGDDPKWIHPGQKLHIPRGWQKTSPTPSVDNPPAMPSIETKPGSEKKPIRVGSIINLCNEFQDPENGFTDGGYLDTRGWIAGKATLPLHYDYVRAFVYTHKSNNWSRGSGSWQILSAVGKPNGEQLEDGDKIRLLNMHPTGGFLDTRGYVRDMSFFKGYPANVGVFTSSVSNRDHASGTWTVQLAATNRDDKLLYHDDPIYLENNFPKAGYLHTYGEVKQHPQFTYYDGQRMFVFASHRANPKVQQHGAYAWKVLLNNLAENLYRIQNQWGDSSAPWHDGGVIKIGDPSVASVKKLTLVSKDHGETLTGKVVFQEEEEPSVDNFKATQREQNYYAVETLRKGSSDVWDLAGEWKFSVRISQKIERMEIEFDDKTLSFHGDMTYRGEDPIRIRGSREAIAPDDATRLLYDYFHPELLLGRTNKIEGVIDATYRLISASFSELSQTAMSTVIEHLQTVTANTTSAINSIAKPRRASSSRDSFDAIDYEFQISQFLNLYTLSEMLNSFLRSKILATIKQSLENHQLDQTLAPLHLVRECFQHIATDHEIIQKATVQRRWNQNLTGDQYFLSEQAVELLIMDKLAIKALAPFQHLLLGTANAQTAAKPLVIITYLSERTHIHLMPYTKQCILIGISYDRVPPAATLFDDSGVIGKDFSAFELMAIPHEMGHYVYQHGKLKDGIDFPTVSAKYADNPYYHWYEEIFADVYGCVIAGPLAALSMQALLVSTDRERSWRDDEEHPTPVLRVFILSEILRILDEIESKILKDRTTRRYDFNATANWLDTNWAKILERWDYAGKSSGRPPRIFLYDSSAPHLETSINVDRVLKKIRPIIVEFATHLLATANFAGNPEVYGELSVSIPWNERAESNADSPKSQLGLGIIAQIVGRELATQKLNQHALLKNDIDTGIAEASNPDKRLQQILNAWDDKGPDRGGGSGGTKKT